jgi:hypothetical protein
VRVPPLLTWVPITLAGIGLNLWILWYLLVKWPAAWSQPLPLIGYLFCGMAALLLAGLLYTILSTSIIFRLVLTKISITQNRPFYKEISDAETTIN